MEILADKPILRREQDALGYWSFASAIAKGLRARASGEGFVVGIQAKWGMGKTSAVNLITCAIEDEEAASPPDEKTKIIRFNPWQFSEIEKLSRGYLAILGQAIGQSIQAQAPKRRFWQSKGAAELLGSAAALGAAAATGGTAVPFMGMIKGGVSGALSLGDQVKQSKELDALSREIKSALSDQRRRLIIILDDLDRLRPSDLVDVITLVKTFGDLPNLIHMLVYDREIVERNVSSVLPNVSDPSYLQKIVQIEFDLPLPTRAGLVAMVNEKIAPIFSEVRSGEVWTEVWRVAFRNYIKSPRDIVKLHNSLSVVWPSIKDDVFSPDFVAIELFRMFDRVLYQTILNNRDLLVGDEYDYGGERLTALADVIKVDRSFEVQRLVASMFPRLEKGLVSGGSIQRPRSISEGRLIGTEQGFDTYFRLEQSQAIVSVSVVEGLKKNIGNSEYISHAFRDAAERSEEYMTSVFDEFIDVIEDTKVVTISTLRGLAEGGGILLQSSGDRRSGFFLIDNSQRMSMTVSKLLDRLQIENGFHELLEIISDPSCDLSVCAFILAKVGEPIALVYADQSERRRLNISDEEIRALADKLAERVEAAFRANDLFGRPEVWMLLKIWGQLRPDDSVPALLNEAATDPEVARTIAFSAMNIRSEGTKGPILRMDRMPPDYVYDMERLVPLVEKHLEASEFSEIDRENLQRFVEAANALKRGETPERY